MAYAISLPPSWAPMIITKFVSRHLTIASRSFDFCEAAICRDPRFHGIRSDWNPTREQSAKRHLLSDIEFRGYLSSTLIHVCLFMLQIKTMIANKTRMCVSYILRIVRNAKSARRCSRGQVALSSSPRGWCCCCVKLAAADSRISFAISYSSVTIVNEMRALSGSRFRTIIFSPHLFRRCNVIKSRRECD